MEDSEINLKIRQFKYELEDLGWMIKNGIGTSVIYWKGHESITFIPEFEVIEYRQEVNRKGNIFRLGYSEILDLENVLKEMRHWSNVEMEKPMHVVYNEDGGFAGIDYFNARGEKVGFLSKEGWQPE